MEKLQLGNKERTFRQALQHLKKSVIEIQNKKVKFLKTPLDKVVLKKCQRITRSKIPSTRSNRALILLWFLSVNLSGHRKNTVVGIYNQILSKKLAS